MNINFTSNRKQSFFKIKKILKPLLSRRKKSKSLINNDENKKLGKNSLKYTSKNNILNPKNGMFYEDDNSDINENSNSSVGTWISEKGDNSMIIDDYDLIPKYNNINNNSNNNNNNRSNNNNNNNIDNNIDIISYHLNYIDKIKDNDRLPHSSSSSTMYNSKENLYGIADSTGCLTNSNSSNTLFIKSLENNYKFERNIDDNDDDDEVLEINTDEFFNHSFSSSESVSTPSILSLNSMHLDYDNNNNNKNLNKGKNKDDKFIPPLTPDSLNSLNSLNHNSLIKTGNLASKKQNYKSTTPPILSYFPREILMQIAMSSDFDTILSLSQTCRFFHTSLNNPFNWTDYWKYTNDKVECLNSLVTNVYQGDQYIFGEIIDLKDDKYISKISKPKSTTITTTTPTANATDFQNTQFNSNYIYKMPNDSSIEIPIERVFFIDYFSTRFGFSYLGGLRIYVPYEYGNNIVHFYDRTREELPCSREHYNIFERYRFSNDLSTSSTSIEDILPPEIKNCPQCLDYYRKNNIDYSVTCTGRPISHISAIWKYNVTPKYTISFDIINSRSEMGYGYRTQDAFIHTNYSFLVNGEELSPKKALLFRQLVLRNS